MKCFLLAYGGDSKESKSTVVDDVVVIGRKKSVETSASRMKVGKLRIKLEPSANWEHPVYRRYSLKEYNSADNSET